MDKMGLMGRWGRRSGLLLGLTIAALAVCASVALAVVIEADNPLNYQQQNYSQQQGIRSTFNNTAPPGPGAGDSHNVTSDLPFGQHSLFSSETVSGGDTAPVKGTQYLTAGDYDFHCSVHPAMTATLHVTNAGTPVERPELDVTILSTNLSRVMHRRLLRVQLEALTSTARDVTIRLERTSDGKRMGSRTGVKVAAGATSTIRVRVRARGVIWLKRALAHGNTFKVTVKAKVPFGTGDEDDQKLS